jgi:tetratricopeptide (TPR) repeat protein
LQLQYWQNGVKLFTHAIKVTRNNSIAHCNLGHALSKQGKYNEAFIHYVKALEINPKYVQAHNDMGYLLGRQGNYKDAIYHYNEALRISPNDVKIRNNFGVLLAQQGNFKDAVYQYNKVLQNNPKYVGAYYNLGKLYANQGNTEIAIHYYRKALLLNPNMTLVLYNMSWIFATHQNTKFRNGEEAIKLAEKLCKITQYNQPLALDALAAAYAETGRFKSAVLIAQKAFKLALSYGPKELALELEKRLALYQNRRPYRQSMHK